LRNSTQTNSEEDARNLILLEIYENIKKKQAICAEKRGWQSIVFFVSILNFQKEWVRTLSEKNFEKPIDK
jgi:hypothetical protein